MELRDDLTAFRVDSAGVKARLEGLPTPWMLTVIVIMTWSAGVAIVGLLAR